MIFLVIVLVLLLLNTVILVGNPGKRYVWLTRQISAVKSGYCHGHVSVCLINREFVVVLAAQMKQRYFCQVHVVEGKTIT